MARLRQWLNQTRLESWTGWDSAGNVRGRRVSAGSDHVARRCGRWGSGKAACQAHVIGQQGWRSRMA